MAYTDIDKSTDYFNTVTYTGDGVDNRDITGLDFQPDMLWSKRRDSADNHSIYDIVRGSGLELRTQTTDADLSRTNNIQALQTNGFQVGDDSQVNASGGTYVSWGWSGGGTGVSNTDGSITSTVSANTTSGFSIVSWTGNGSHPSTIGHGLGSVPKMIITKKRSAALNWHSYHVAIGNGAEIYLNKTNAKSNNSTWNYTTPTSSVFTVGNNDVNISGATFIAYCFAEKKGFSKFGSYTGNGSTDGTFIYTGFKPAFVLFKRTSSTSNWSLFDNKRNTFNITDSYLQADTSSAEQEFSDIYVDFLSNGIKQRGTNISLNSSGASYIYMAFAENPFVTSGGIPTTAR